MKLLNKNEVQDLKQKERGVEIREGAKLAQKIDVLRETASEEETKLSQFRIATLNAIRSEILEISTERDAIRAEVIELREERKRLQLAIESVKITNN